MEPEIRYARTDDGIDIAFAIVGQGPPVLALRQYMAADVHSELSEEERGVLPWSALATSHTVILFDWRGTGLSGAASSQSIETGLSDMQAVVAASELTTFDIFAALTPAHFAIAYAAAHPERVRRMVLWNPGQIGGSMRSLWTDWNLPQIEMTHFPEFTQLVALKIFGWERAAAARRFSEMMTERYTGESWARLNESIEAIDGTAHAAGVRCPSLIVVDHNVANVMLVNPERQQFIRRLAASIPNAQLSIVRRGESRAAFDRILAFIGPTERDRPPDLPSGTAIILFADIADSTAQTERMGDAAFRERHRGLDARLREIIEEHGGAPVAGRTMGDGVLASFASGRTAIAAAVAMADAAHDLEMPLHLGIHAGDIIREENNVWGGAVNVAARVSTMSAPGEILVSATVRDLARTSSDVVFEDRGEFELKGVGEAVRVYAVRAREAG